MVSLRDLRTFTKRELKQLTILVEHISESRLKGIEVKRLIGREDVFRAKRGKVRVVFRVKKGEAFVVLAEKK